MRFCLLVALALFTLGCSEQGAAQDANAPVKILTSQMYVTVRNDSGAPLNDVTVVDRSGRAADHLQQVRRPPRELRVA